MEFTTIKGFKDILPDEVQTWQRLEAEARRIFFSFGYQEIRPPLMEMTELFSRSIGEETDIVSKEMYTLADSKGKGLTLRPEATASVVRAYIQHRLYQNNPVVKLFTIGPMFRHERPQKGRFRQFHQIDVEVMGDSGPRSDAEVILLVMTLFRVLDLADLSLHINSLGCPACRPAFREQLRSYLARNSGSLCADCQRRAETNPLRVFDCKVEGCRDIVRDAPSILSYICEACAAHFTALQNYLEESKIAFVIDPTLVRGLDYYARTAFEVQTEKLGSQSAVAGGGRYDGLIRQLGGPDHPGIGFAIGMERLVALMEEGSEKKPAQGPDVFLVGLGEEAGKKVFGWVDEIRRSGLWAEMDYGSRGLKAQMKTADRLRAGKVLIVGENELASGRGVLRDMATKAQEEIAFQGLVERIKRDAEAEKLRRFTEDRERS
ncbi:MAG: histidine--tRNA ligase [Desulfobacterales bacterium]|nr:histidine--tRNA ligase [Desulfobacterales bacterium]